MAENTLQAKRFAQAAFEIAKQRQEFDQWRGDLLRIAALARNTEFLAVMENPKFSFNDKSKLLTNQLKGINKLALNLAYLLTNQGIFGIITEISSCYQEQLDDYRGLDNAEVTTAIPLDEKEKSKLMAYLEKVTGKKINLTVKVDPNIIGGMVARVGGKIIDGSTGSQLAALKNELANTGR